eukprot:TRINITY_DN80100_c0_g1_i1.p1 TRINITY_DN80100_c0_g1~~TRINITY_DN80100_c0_g1_i1.p1  ORF type:complete len:713 (+),score=210.89 TRINITY_DN80100_c0_g1_i1:104-2242(+)
MAVGTPRAAFGRPGPAAPSARPSATRAGVIGSAPRQTGSVAAASAVRRTAPNAKPAAKPAARQVAPAAKTAVRPTPPRGPPPARGSVASTSHSVIMSQQPRTPPRKPKKAPEPEEELDMPDFEEAAEDAVDDGEEVFDELGDAAEEDLLEMEEGLEAEGELLEEEFVDAEEPVPEEEALEEEELMAPEEAAEEFMGAEEEALEEAVEEAMDEAVEEAVPEEEPEDEAEEDAMEREDDLKLEDVPEDMRESVEGNLELKRALTGETDSDSPAAKRARTMSEDLRPLEPEREELLKKWRLTNDRGARYVIWGAAEEELDGVAASNFTPRLPKPTDQKPRSCCEQLSEAIRRTQEDMLGPGGEVSIADTFRHNKQLTKADYDLITTLMHKDLQYVMENFDSSRTVSDLVDEAKMEMPAETAETLKEAAPDKPGVFTMGRALRLELIDPSADALVIGDANLTFANLLVKHRKALGHYGRVVATTFEKIHQLRERYKEIDSTVKFLEDQQAEVLHDVDGTRLAVDPRFLGMEGTFGAAYYNFPHAGVMHGFFDGHPFVRWRHENLMTLFFRALRPFMKPGGIVKVASNSRATGVRYTDILNGAKMSEFEHVETVPFLEWQLRDYMRSYGDKRDVNRRPEDGENYRAQKKGSDMVYCFVYKPSGDTVPKPRVRLPPSREDLYYAQEGKLARMSARDKQARVDEIYKTFLSYVTGIHTG